MSHNCSRLTASRLLLTLFSILVLLLTLAPSRSTQAAGGAGQVVSWVHIGDLHMVDTSLSNYTDLQTIVNDINSYMKGGINFAFLPGDNANDGAESEYQLIHGVIQNLQVPLKAVVGDHDLKSGGTSLFQQYIYPKVPDSFDIGNYRFLLLNSFDIQNEIPFITSELTAAKAAGMQSVLMFHEFDVNQCCTALQSLIQNDNVILVDTGHTHTNVLANDGHTIYAATRSTGQASEGPVGFSVVSLDNGIVSWKFQALGQWPFVSITSPADAGLITNSGEIVRGTATIHAKAFSDASITSVTYSVDGGSPVSMTSQGESLWSASWNSTAVSDGTHTILVTVTDAKGQKGTDQISAVVNQSGTYSAPNRSFGPEGNALSANTARGLLGATGAGGAPKGGGAGKGKPAPCAATPTPTPTQTTASATAVPCGPGKGPGKGGKPKPAPCTTATPTPTATTSSQGQEPACKGKGGPKKHHPLVSTNVQQTSGGVSPTFTVTFTSSTAGRGQVLFGSGPGCVGLVQTATMDQGAGTTTHTVTVSGNDLAGTVGDNGLQPGATYWYEMETISTTGIEIDNNGGSCYSVTIPST